MTYPPLGPPSPGGEQWPYPPEPQPQPWPPGPSDSPPPPRRNKWLWASLALAVAVILVLSGVVIAQLTGGDSSAPATTAAAPSTAQAQTSAPQQSMPQPTAAAPRSSTSCDGYTVQLDATSPPGWQPTVGKRGLAYAAPPEWSVKDCGVQLGWQKPCPNGAPGVCAIRAMSAAADLASPSCANSTVGMAGVAGSKNPDINAALNDEMATVPLIYSSKSGQTPPVTFGPIRQFMIGSAPAVQRVATVTGVQADCLGSSALHSMVVTTVPNVEGSVVFIISLRQDTPGAPDPDVINKIVATLRSAG